MRVLIQETLRPRSVTDYPTVVLRKDNWDDYGFKTMFYVRLHLGTDRVVDLETVKILHREQNGGPTPFPGTSFDSSFLHDEYCSLGQSYSYYELLHGLGEDVYRPYLDGMCDVVYSPTILAAFKDKEGFSVSLLRFDGADRALEDGAVLFERRDADAAPATLEFSYRFPRVPTTLDFSVGGPSALPNRVSVVIGYNGSGKTRLLANLARSPVQIDSLLRKSRLSMRPESSSAADPSSVPSSPSPIARSTISRSPKGWAAVLWR